MLSMLIKNFKTKSCEWTAKKLNENLSAFINSKSTKIKGRAKKGTMIIITAFF